jgi:hypothetical protein
VQKVLSLWRSSDGTQGAIAVTRASRWPMSRAETSPSIPNADVVAVASGPAGSGKTTPTDGAAVLHISAPSDSRVDTAPVGADTAFVF